MKKSFVLILGIFLILFVAGLFVEVKATMTDDEINNTLRENGFSGAHIINEYYGGTIPSSIMSAYAPTNFQRLLGEGYFVGPLNATGPIGAEDFILTKKGLEQFFPDQKNKILSDIEILFSTNSSSNDDDTSGDEDDDNNSGGTAVGPAELTGATATVASGHSFIIETNAYKGIKYRITGFNNNEPIIEKVSAN